MYWIVTLIGFWIALVVAGVILTAVLTVALSRINSNFFACLPALMVMACSYIILMAATYFFVPQEYWDPTYNPQELELEAFVEQMAPSLHSQIQRLREREKEAATKVAKLKKLAADRPRFADQVNVEIAKWEELHSSIENTLEDIHEKTEQALVDFKIDEITGREKFSKISNDLQTEADRVLDHARILQSSVESNVVSKEDKIDDSPTLEDLLKELD